MEKMSTRGFPSPLVGAWVASPKLSKRDCKPEEQDRGLPERLRSKLHSDVLERAFEGLKGLLGASPLLVDLV